MKASYLQKNTETEICRYSSCYIAPTNNSAKN